MFNVTVLFCFVLMWRRVAMHLAFWRNLLPPSSAQKTHYVQQLVGHFKLSCIIYHFLSLLFRDVLSAVWVSFRSAVFPLNFSLSLVIPVSVLSSIVLNGALHCVFQTTAARADVEPQITNTGTSIRRLKATVTPRDASVTPKGQYNCTHS